MRRSLATMLLLIVIIVLFVNRRRWYAYGPYWGYPHYRGYGPYGPANPGYVWNGYAWQPVHAPNHPPFYGYAYPYGFYRRPHL